MFPRQIWEEIGGYDEEFRNGYEDWEFWLRVVSHDYVAYRLSEILFYYRKHNGSMLSEANQMHRELVRQVHNAHKLGSYPKGPILEPLNFKGELGHLARLVYSRLGTVLPEKLREWAKKIYYKSWRGNGRLPATKWTETEFDGFNYVPTGWTDTKGSARTPVLFILPWFQVGGVERVYLALLESLPQSIRPIIVTTEADAGPWMEKFQAITEDIHNLYAISSVYTTQLTYLLDLIERHMVKRVQICNSKFGYYAIPTLRKFFPNLRIVDHIHMNSPVDPWDYMDVGAKFDEYLDKRVVITDMLKDVMVREYGIRPSKIDVIPNGFSLPEFQPKPVLLPTVKIGFVGRFVSQKDPLMFIDICRELLRQQGRLLFEFTVVGKGPLEGGMRKKIRNYDLEWNFRFLPHETNINEFMRNLDVLVAPSVREGLPTVGIEAMAVGLPVVASSVPGWTDLISDQQTGLLVDERSPQAYVAAISRLIYDSNFRIHLIQAARCHVLENYDVTRMANQFLQAYQLDELPAHY
jgi:glycosyltransferase involved in cell wall biosynthesis